MRWVEFPYCDNSLVSSNRDEYCRHAGRACTSAVCGGAATCPSATLTNQLRRLRPAIGRLERWAATPMRGSALMHILLS